MKTSVIHYKYLPTNPARPLLLSSVVYLYMDRYGAPGWAFGVFWTLAAMLFISAVVSVIREECLHPVLGKQKEK